MTRRAACRLRATAARLRRLPVCARAYAEGVLSGGQIEAIVARLDDELVEVFAAQEAELVDYLAPLTVAGVSRAMGAWVLGARPEGCEPREPERSVYLSKTLEDRYVLQGSLDAERGSILEAALRLGATDDGERRRSPATRRADALAEMCRFFLDHHRSRPSRRHRPHLNVPVDFEDLVARRGGRVVDGPVLDATTVSTLLCDSVLHRVVMAGRSAILDYGMGTRTIPTALWNAPGRARRALPLSWL